METEQSHCHMSFQIVSTSAKVYINVTRSIGSLTEPWAMAPTTKTMGSSFGITSFKFVSFSEWKDVPRKKC